MVALQNAGPRSSGLTTANGFTSIELAFPADSTSLNSLVIRLSLGLRITPRWESEGMLALISSTRLPDRSELIQVTPVRFPPGCGRLVTSPASSASQVTATIGILSDARFAAHAP